MQNVFVIGGLILVWGFAIPVHCKAETSHPNSTASAFRHIIEAYSQDASRFRVSTGLDFVRPLTGLLSLRPALRTEPCSSFALLRY